MKVLVAKFVLEANANIPMKCDLENMDIRFGQDCIDRMQLNGIFDEEAIELVPAIYADGNSSGVMKKAAFDYIESRIIDAVKNHLSDMNGMYLHLHGASEVEEIGSGDHHILKEIRKIVGPYMPIAIVCDPHGNLSKTYVESATIIRSYRESPHTDIEATISFVCHALIKLLKKRQNIHAVYRKLPMLLGGEQSVSSDEPVLSINKYLNRLEKDPQIMSCSWHVGYIRHDCSVSGAGIVVVPEKESDQAYAEQIADQLAQYVWDKRHEFHYTGLTAKPAQALEMALDFDESPVFITDSGDNVTSGATGWNTFVLRQVLNLKNAGKKKFLFASINHPETYNQLLRNEIGSEVSISLGKNEDDLTKAANLNVVVKYKGRQAGTKLFGENGDFGGCVTVSVKDYPIDIIITDTNHPFVEHHQVLAAGVDWMDYDSVIVKIGYAFPEIKQAGKLCVMSLTDGATLQYTSALPFKQIMRPMYPIDQI